MPGTLVDPERVSANHKRIVGTHTTSSAADAVTFSQLSTILSVVVALKTDPALDPFSASATWTGNVVTIKTWKGTSTSNPTQVASATTGNVVSYVVEGY